MVFKSLADKSDIDKEGEEFKGQDKAEKAADRKRQRQDAGIEKRRTDKERDAAELIKMHKVPQARAKYDMREESK